MKGCLCHFVNWQIHTFISKETIFDLQKGKCEGEIDTKLIRFTYVFIRIVHVNACKFYPIEVEGRDSETQP